MQIKVINIDTKKVVVDFHNKTLDQVVEFIREHKNDAQWNEFKDANLKLRCERIVCEDYDLDGNKLND